MLCGSRFNNAYNTHIFIQLQESVGAGFVYPISAKILHCHVVAIW